MWSWLYIVVEMLEGSLPWRTSSGDASAGSEHSPKETAQRLKQEALENPHILSISGKLSGALLSTSTDFHHACMSLEPEPMSPQVIIVHCTASGTLLLIALVLVRKGNHACHKWF